MFDILLPLFVIIPVLIAVFLYVFSTLQRARWVAAVVQAAFSALAVWLLLDSRESDIIVTVGGYGGLLGITLRVDVIAAVFILLTVIIFLAVVIYNMRSPYDHTGRLYWFLLFILEGALIGLFMSRDFFNIFVLVEVSTVVVTILLMYDRKRRNVFAGMAFIMVNIVVMQFYLFGLGYIYFLTGVMDMEAATAAIAELDRTDLALPYALIMTSIAAKCSLLPLLTWLPKVNSLAGSRFTIAAIMSGLHIKSGVYMFLRFQPVFGGMGTEFFLVIGFITAFAGVALALAQKDVRLMLAYSTMAQVGLIIVGLTLGDDYSYMGAVFHVVNHALFKAALFVGAGMITFLYRSKDITKMRGLFMLDPWLASAHALAILGIVGAPFFNGFISKYFLAYGAGGVLEWLITAVNLGTVMIFVRYSAIFFGHPLDEAKKVDSDWCRNAAIFGLGGGSLLLGLYGTEVMSFIFNQPVTVDVWGYLEKSGIFALSLGFAVLVYRKFLAKREILKSLKGLQLSFKTMCVSIGFFFAVILVYVGKIT